MELLILSIEFLSCLQFFRYSILKKIYSLLKRKERKEEIKNLSAYVNYLIFFSFGVMSMKDFAKIMGVKMIVGVIFLVTILFGWWNIIGVL